MPYRDELEALRARLSAALAERDQARAKADTLERLLRMPAGPADASAREGDPRWCSVPGGEPRTITLRNSFDRKVEVFWLSYEGKERSIGTLVPGGSSRQQSYVGHVWRFVDSQSGLILAHARVEPETEELAPAAPERDAAARR